MDDKKREDVVRMLAEVKKETDRKPARRKTSAPKATPRPKSSKKNGGARIVYIEVDNNTDLAGALTAITQIKRDE